MDNLQISTQDADGRATLTVKVPVEVVQKTYDKRARELAKTARVDGFRRGKVPLSYIDAHFGASIRQEAINDAIKDSVIFAINDQKLRSVGAPNIDDVRIEEGFLVYQATVELLPKIQIQGLDKIEVERQVAKVEADDVDEMVLNLQKQRQTFELKDGALAEGDQALIDFEGFIDDEKFEGGSATNQTLLIGSNRMIAGFESQMVGMQAGETRTIEVTFPEDYQAEHLQGKDAKFKITLHKIETPKLPELNDEFFTLFGVKEGGLDKLKQDVQKNMEREVARAQRNQVKRATFDALVEQNEFDIPSALLAQEIDRQRNQMIERFGAQFGGKFDKSMLPDELFEEQALRAARLGLLLSQIIDDNKITVDSERVDSYIREMAENYEDPKEVIEYFSTDASERANIESVVLEDQIVDWLLEHGKVSEKTVKYQELLATLQQP